MSESTVETEKDQNKRECLRCKKVFDKGHAFWSMPIDEELGRIYVCQECWTILDAVYNKITQARDAFVRMVYEHPGHEKTAPAVVGHIVMTVRRSTEEELAKFGWEDSWPTDVLVLSSGAVIIPAADEEENDRGALRGIYHDGRTFHF